MSNAIVKIPQLSDLEKDELELWRSKGLPALGIVPSVKMYELFLMGSSCEEIVKSNDNKYPLGMVVDARLRHEWDRRRDEYLERLYGNAEDTVKQRQTESAMFITDVLAATHKLNADKLHKFMQTGDPDDLPDAFKVDSINKYRILLDLLMSITGQRTQNGFPTASQVQIVAKGDVSVQGGPNQKLTSDDAFDILQKLEQLDSIEGKKK